MFVSHPLDFMSRILFFFVPICPPHHYALKFPSLNIFPINLPLMKSGNETIGVTVPQVPLTPSSVKYLKR